MYHPVTAATAMQAAAAHGSSRPRNLRRGAGASGAPASIVSRADEILRNLELVYGSNEIVPSRSLKERPGDFESMRDHYAYRREYF